MAKRKLQEFGHYKFGARGILVLGDKFHASGGPYFQLAARGARLRKSFPDPGTYIFLRYCEEGWYKFIVARPTDGTTDERLYVGKRLIRREPVRTVYVPYKITKVRI